MFNCTWSQNNCKFEDGVMKLTIDEKFEDNYTGAEYRTNDMYGYGLYEVSMKPIKNDGVVSSFFTYTGPTDGNPWDEIDIEFLGKDTTKVQFNYFTNGVGNHEYLYDLGFDATEEFHTYGFKWSADGITWCVDGEDVYTATENLPVTPGKLMMNVWNGKGVDSWLNAFDGKTPLTAEYQWARFTAE
jgi:endoglucanase